MVEGPLTYDFTLHLRVRDHAQHDVGGLFGTAFGHSLSFGLFQFHGHGS